MSFKVKKNCKGEKEKKGDNARQNGRKRKKERGGGINIVFRPK
jgi:hypothetical protein